MLKHDDCFLDCYIDGCLLSVMQSSILVNKMTLILQTVAATWILFNIYTHPINHTIAIRIITSTFKSICFRLFANTNQCKRICVYTMHDSWMPMHHSNSIQSISILLFEMLNVMIDSTFPVQFYHFSTWTMTDTLCHTLNIKIIVVNTIILIIANNTYFQILE